MAKDRFLRPWLDRKGFSIVGWIVAVAIGLFLAALALEAWDKPLWSPEAAGWAQAVGTVGAIIFAWWQGHRSTYLAERRRRDDVLRFLGGLAHLAQSSIEVAKQSDEALANGDLRTFEEVAVLVRDNLRLYQKYNQMPVQTWPSVGLATSLEFCLEELGELSSRYTKLRARLKQLSVTGGEKSEYHERFLVFGWRCSSLLRQVDFQRAINEPGPGPIISFMKRKPAKATGISPTES